MNIIKDKIFSNHNLDTQKIESIVSAASGPSIDFSDLYMQYSILKVGLARMVLLKVVHSKLTAVLG